MTPIVFLHIPKTAGQTIHNELSRLVGSKNVSPVRVHTQVPAQGPQFTPGYALYSGHIDWDALETVPAPRFTFTVLRNPKERIASFYLYLLKEARALTCEALERPENTGMKAIVSRSADAYFFGGDAAWQTFIHDHYNNFYCAYLASRKMRGWTAVRGLSQSGIIAQALENTALIERIYGLGNLAALERDIQTRFGGRITVAGNFFNMGDPDRAAPRWPKLLNLFKRDESRAKLETFTTSDIALMNALGLGGEL